MLAEYYRLKLLIIKRFGQTIKDFFTASGKSAIRSSSFLGGCCVPPEGVAGRGKGAGEADGEREWWEGGGGEDGYRCVVL